MICQIPVFPFLQSVGFMVADAEYVFTIAGSSCSSKMWRQSALTILSMICLLGVSASQTYVKKLTGDEFRAVAKTQKNIHVVFFSHSGPVPEELLSTLRIFTAEYEKAAETLLKYDVNFYNVDCKLETVEEYCNKENTGRDVIVFREDVELLTIGVESMFDQDSIISNVLQIALLREVPILQSSQERHVYEDQHKEGSDIIFSYQKAIGTREHRVFIEVAFAYRDFIKFAIATDLEALEGLSHENKKGSEEAVWILQCKDMSRADKKPCPSANFYGNFDPEELGTFIDNQNLKQIYGIEEPFESVQLKDIPLRPVYIFYDGKSSQYVQDEAKKMAKTFKGTIALLMINAEQTEASAFGYTDDIKVPTVAYKENEQSDLILMEPREEPEDFIQKCLTKSRTDGAAMRSAGEGGATDSMSYVSEVEMQDDEVARTMSQLKFHLELDAAVVLNEKNFLSEVNTRDVFAVLFHLPFDALSSGTLYSFIKAAETYTMEHEKEQTPNPFGIVNCFDWSDVCSSNNVTTWPTFLVFRKDRPVKKIQGILSPTSIKETVEMFKSPAPTVLNSVEEISSLIEAQETAQPSAREVLILGLTDDEESTNVFMQAADDLHGQLVLSLAKKEVAATWAKKMGVSLPHVVVSKLKDTYQPVKSIPMKGMDSVELVAKIKDAAMPVFPELTPSRFPALYLKKQPLAIFFTHSPDSPDLGEEGTQTVQLLGNLAAQEKFKGLQITWMDMANKMTQQIMETYTRETSQPTLVVADLSKGCVYVYKNQLTDEGAIEKWLNDVKQEDVDFTVELPKNDWKPHSPGFDFLKMIDEDAAEQGAKKEEEPDDVLDYFSQGAEAEEMTQAGGPGDGVPADPSAVPLHEHMKDSSPDMASPDMAQSSPHTEL